MGGRSRDKAHISASRLCAVVLVTTALVGASTSVGASAGGQASEVQVSVTSTSTGAFGPLLGGVEPDLSVQDLVEAVTLRKGERITIVASGEVVLNIAAGGAAIDGPDGLTSLTRANPLIYFPLEEAFVDASGGVLPDPPVLNVGGLMGAFVPEAVVDEPGFRARNDDPDPNPIFPVPDPPLLGSVASDDLFLIGAGPFIFEASEEGTLFLGVNDSFTPNNAGAFAVAITPGSNGLVTTVCHRGRSITVSTQAVLAHESHGDTPGAC
jgi:hypothetical protein